MRTLIAAAMLLGLCLSLNVARAADKSGEGEGNADVLNGLMLKASDRCYGMAGAERAACCQRYFDNLCPGQEIAATAPPAAPAPAPAPAPSTPSARPQRGGGGEIGSSNTAGGDGPANVLNGFVMKELQQCRALLPHERRPCCERLLHPNACGE